MQRKSTPSHPFHAVLLNVLVWSCCFITTGVIAEPVFHIECPNDVTVNCDAELWDLSIYGNALVYGYNGPESAGPPVSVDYNLNNCNTGTIVRTWVAYDYGGQPYYCSQTITVGGGGYANIHWPPDYIIHSCSPNTNPDDLPAPYDRPDIYGGGGSCSQLMMNYEDQVFNINPPACTKILRKWTVIDWCSYNPNSYNPQGIWSYTQIIKITPENPPTIWCPADTVVSAGGDCTGGYVHLPSAYGTSDCGAGVIITNGSPYATSHGPDASGYYPLGTTKVSYWADDGCGQKASCSMYVTVRDMKKPTPVCYYGISVSLMQMPDGYYMDLRPSFFDKGSFDNCTPKNKLKLWVEPSRVGCDEIGPTAVRLFVEDESGNVEYCNTLVYVQDNMGMCPPTDGDITGNVNSIGGDMMNDVKVSVVELSDFSMTDDAGAYALTSVPFGKAYTITPTYHSDDINGVSALDMTVLLKHILGVESINDPYRYIAADIDRSGRVSVGDLLMMKELIMKDYYGLQPTTSWRFIDESYVFTNPSNPLAESFPESYQISMFTESMSALNFVGVKLGDLTGDAVVNITGQPEVEVRSPHVTISLPDMMLVKGESYEIPVIVDGFADLEALQFAFNVDNNALDVVAAKANNTIQGLDLFNKALDYNIVSGIWYGIEPLKSGLLGTLSIQALQDVRLDEALELASGSKSIAYRRANPTAVEVDLAFSGEVHVVASDLPSESVSKMKVGQNYPNPFSDVTVIPVELVEAGPLELTVLDLNGRTLASWSFSGTVGLQEIPLDARELVGDGLVLCRVTSGSESATIRILVNSER